MPFNLYSQLTDWQALAVEGPDARDFLNRVTSADFKRLQPGRFTPATLLTANGKLTLYFKALMLDPARFLLLIPRQSPGVAAAQHAFDEFEKIHFREQLTMRPENLMYVRALVTDPSCVEALKDFAPAESGRFLASDGGFSLNEARWALEPVKLDLGFVVSEPQAAGLMNRLESAGLEEADSLEGFRLRAGDPACPSELNAGTLAPEARLDDAVHEGKGCYPGQEVVERIRSMGQPPRLLALLTGAGEPPVLGANGATILADGQPAGELTSAAPDPVGGGWVALGYVKRVLAKPGATYSVGSQSVSLRVR